jgi:hypothetical protein
VWDHFIALVDLALLEMDSTAQVMKEHVIRCFIELDNYHEIAI